MTQRESLSFYNRYAKAQNKEHANHDNMIARCVAPGEGRITTNSIKVK